MAGKKGYLGYKKNKNRYFSFVSDKKDAVSFDLESYKDNAYYFKCKLDGKTCYLDYHTGGGEVYGTTHGSWYANSWLFQDDKFVPRVHTGGLALCPDRDPEYNNTLYVSLRLDPFIAKEV